jgi:hypothetical protein
LKPRTKDRGGRPRKRAVRAGEKVQIGVRISPALRVQLERAADKSGRSLTQESELRIERSFDRAGTLLELLRATYGPQLAAVLSILGETLRMVIAHATAHLLTPSDSEFDDHYKALNAAYRGGDLSHPYVMGQVREAILAVVSALGPPIESLKLPDGIAPPTLQAEQIAEMFIRDLIHPPKREKEYAEQIKALLGDLRISSLFADYPPSLKGTT